MKPLLYKFRCNNCNCSFKSPSLSGEIYGEFIMRSHTTGESAYLNAFSDITFNEVEKLFDHVIQSKETGKLDQVDIFQSIFSVSCDLANDESQYQIGLNPVCPNCHSRDMAAWQETNPPEYDKEDIKFVTHEVWNKLTYEEKLVLVDKAINNYLSEKS